MPLIINDLYLINKIKLPKTNTFVQDSVNLSPLSDCPLYVVSLFNRFYCICIYVQVCVYIYIFYVRKPLINFNDVGYTYKNIIMSINKNYNLIIQII